jgi:rare lipoprotein A
MAALRLELIRQRSEALRFQLYAGRVGFCAALLTFLLVAGQPSDTQAAERHPASAKPARAERNAENRRFYSVLGKRYQVLASSDGYRARGIASWYGRPFHGRPTSSGEMYDMNEMTAAHTTLPLPTWVEVTNLTNGKRILVKVNDRGPFVADRVIDLSFAAATALDIVRDGTARVEVRAVAPPRTPTTAAAAVATRGVEQRRAATTKLPLAAAAAIAPAVKTQPAPPPRVVAASAAVEQERLFAEAGRFTQRADAVALVDTLRAQGLVNAFVVTEDGRRRSTHRVRVGPLVDATAVAAMSDRLRGLGAKRSHSVVMP